MREIVKYFRKNMFNRYSIKDTDIVDVFLSTFAQGRKGTLYRMTYSDAKKFIAHPKTKGQNFGGEWMYLIDNVDYSEPLMKDDGRFDEILAELKVTLHK